MSFDGIRGIATQIGRALTIAVGDDRLTGMGAAGAGAAAPPGDPGEGPGIPIFPL